MSSYELINHDRSADLYSISSTCIKTSDSQKPSQMLQEAEAAKEVAEQRFWLPLERSKGRRMGELCVSLLFTKVSCVCLNSDTHCLLVAAHLF